MLVMRTCLFLGSVCASPIRGSASTRATTQRPNHPIALIAILLGSTRGKTYPTLLVELHEMLGRDYPRDWLAIDHSDGWLEDAAESVMVARDALLADEVGAQL